MSREWRKPPSALLMVELGNSDWNSATTSGIISPLSLFGDHLGSRSHSAHCVEVDWQAASGVGANDLSAERQAGGRLTF